MTLLAKTTNLWRTSPVLDPRHQTSTLDVDFLSTWRAVKQAFRCKLLPGVACITYHLVVQQIFMLYKDVASINSL